MDPEVVAKVVDNIQGSSVKETAMLIVLVLMGAAYLAEKAIAWNRSRKAEDQQIAGSVGQMQEAINIITAKDQDNIPVFYSMARNMKDIVKLFSEQNTLLTNLFNHNTEILKRLDDNTDAARRAAVEARDAVRKP